MKTLTALLTVAVILAASSALALSWKDDNVDGIEERAGALSALVLNPDDEIYGIEIASGSWFVNTPIYGEVILAALYNGLEDDTAYGGLGISLRAMPHWDKAPFLGAGEAYNYNFNSTASLDGRGESYWVTYMEGGMRFQGGTHFYEVLFRYSWPDVEREVDDEYWSLRFAVGSLLW
jgi:hypothetical protein